MPKPLYADFASGLHGSDYVFVERKAKTEASSALQQAASAAVQSKKRLFGLFGGAGGNFEPPKPADSPGKPDVIRATTENPLLWETVGPTLQVLGQDPDGFFVMFEQGDIDWAAHANDFNWIVGTTWDLDRAVQTAIDYIEKPGDDMTWDNTLLLVTADHANSFLRLNPDMPLNAGDGDQCLTGCAMPAFSVPSPILVPVT